MNIFLDLDETLWHTKMTFDVQAILEANDGQYDTFSTFEDDNYTYLCFLRPEAMDIIKLCEEYMGEGKVKVLTTATRAYAEHFIAEFDFPFDLKNVYTRENINSWPGILEEFEHDHNVLIDNETFYYHTMGNCNKVKFLGKLEIEDYYNIEQFAPDFRTGYGMVDVNMEKLKAFLDERKSK